MYKEIEGDLISLAKQGMFDVIAHGCNCFCRMKRGLAPQMAEAFDCDKFPLEESWRTGDINKLGQIDHGETIKLPNGKYLLVTNAYTQYHWDTKTKPLDYIALRLCLRKMNHIFRGRHIGLPQIGCHLAGGHWDTVKHIIKEELKNCDVTVVIYKP